MTCAYPNPGNENQLTESLQEKTQKHPCYSFEAHRSYARMHLPVAPACNISCNYCNRKFDCVNESRPGVTSEVLKPEPAKRKFDRVKAEIGQLSVVGIAGPGDALANWENTRQTIELIRAENPDMGFCLSTNGLMLPEYAEEIANLGVTHVTVTMNCLDSAIGAKIYKYIYYKGTRYEGEEGVKILTENQIKGIQLLAKLDVVVKINIVMIPGINESHIPEVVKKVKELGVYITNIMPLIPAQGSVFETFPQTSMKDIKRMRTLCELDILQMKHCKQCRADAIGLLGEDRSQEFMENPPTAGSSPIINRKPAEKKLKIAVTSKKGKQVDLHFGHAKEFLVYEISQKGITYLETRQSDNYCYGIEECDTDQAKSDAVVNLLVDCDAVLTLRIGHSAQQALLERGVRSVEYCFGIEEGLLFAQEQLAQEVLV